MKQMRSKKLCKLWAAGLVLSLAALPSLSGCRQQAASVDAGASASASVGTSNTSSAANAVAASQAMRAGQSASEASLAAAGSHAAGAAAQASSAPQEALAPLSPQVLAVAQTVPKPATRIVALNSNALEALRLLQAEDRVIGVFSGILHRFDFWEKFDRLPQVGKWSEPNVEAIARLAPDVVIHYRATAPYLEEKLKPFGIKVLRLDLFKVETLANEFRLLGEVMGRQQQAERFVSWHLNNLTQIQQQVSQAPAQKTTYLEAYSDYSATGPGSGLHQQSKMAGGANIAASLDSAYPNVTSEWVVEQNPEFIFKISSKTEGYVLHDAAPYNQIRDRILARPAWGHIRAVKDGRVHVINGELANGPRASVAIAYMARWMYPEHTAALDPEALHREYFEQFIHVPFAGRYFSDPVAQP